MLTESSSFIGTDSILVFYDIGILDYWFGVGVTWKSYSSILSITESSTVFCFAILKDFCSVTLLGGILSAVVSSCILGFGF